MKKSIKWTKEADQRMTKLVLLHGTRKWSVIAAEFEGRTGKQCRERWHNQLDPSIKRCSWSNEEKEIFVWAHDIYGNSWAMISQHLPGRTDNSVKNYWNSTKRRAMRAAQKDRKMIGLPEDGKDLNNLLYTEDASQIEATMEAFLPSLISDNKKLLSTSSTIVPKEPKPSEKLKKKTSKRKRTRQTDCLAVPKELETLERHSDLLYSLLCKNKHLFASVESSGNTTTSTEFDNDDMNISGERYDIVSDNLWENNKFAPLVATDNSFSSQYYVESFSPNIPLASIDTNFPFPTTTTTSSSSLGSPLVTPHLDGTTKVKLQFDDTAMMSSIFDTQFEGSREEILIEDYDYIPPAEEEDIKTKINNQLPTIDIFNDDNMIHRPSQASKRKRSNNNDDSPISKKRKNNVTHHSPMKLIISSDEDIESPFNAAMDHLDNIISPAINLEIVGRKWCLDPEKSYQHFDDDSQSDEMMQRRLQAANNSSSNKDKYNLGIYGIQVLTDEFKDDPTHEDEKHVDAMLTAAMELSSMRMEVDTKNDTRRRTSSKQEQGEATA